jgi:hypothetical protein
MGPSAQHPDDERSIFKLAYLVYPDDIGFVTDDRGTTSRELVRGRGVDLRKLDS